MKQIRSEAFFRRAMKDNAQDLGFKAETLICLKGETVGLARLLTGIDDEAQAIEELVNDALNRWARVQNIEAMCSGSKAQREELDDCEDEDEALVASDIHKTYIPQGDK